MMTYTIESECPPLRAIYEMQIEAATEEDAVYEFRARFPAYRIRRIKDKFMNKKQVMGVLAEAKERLEEQDREIEILRTTRRTLEMCVAIAGRPLYPEKFRGSPLMLKPPIVNQLGDLRDELGREVERDNAAEAAAAESVTIATVDVSGAGGRHWIVKKWGESREHRKWVADMTKLLIAWARKPGTRKKLPKTVEARFVALAKALHANEAGKPVEEAFERFKSIVSATAFPMFRAATEEK